LQREQEEGFLVLCTLRHFGAIGSACRLLYLASVYYQSDDGRHLAAVAGIMVFISLDQLVPHAKKYSTGHQSVYGLISGMVIMAITLILL